MPCPSNFGLIEISLVHVKNTICKDCKKYSICVTLFNISLSQGCRKREFCCGKWIGKHNFQRQILCNFCATSLMLHMNDLPTFVFSQWLIFTGKLFEHQGYKSQILRWKYVPPVAPLAVALVYPFHYIVIYFYVLHK